MKRLTNRNIHGFGGNIYPKEYYDALNRCWFLENIIDDMETYLNQFEEVSATTHNDYDKGFDRAVQAIKLKLEELKGDKQ